MWAEIRFEKRVGLSSRRRNSSCSLNLRVDRSFQTAASSGRRPQDPLIRADLPVDVPRALLAVVLHHELGDHVVVRDHVRPQVGEVAQHEGLPGGAVGRAPGPAASWPRTSCGSGGGPRPGSSPPPCPPRGIRRGRSSAKRRRSARIAGLRATAPERSWLARSRWTTGPHARATLGASRMAAAAVSREGGASFFSSGKASAVFLQRRPRSFGRKGLVPGGGSRIVAVERGRKGSPLTDDVFTLARAAASRLRWEAETGAPGTLPRGSVSFPEVTGPTGSRPGGARRACGARRTGAAGRGGCSQRSPQSDPRRLRHLPTRRVTLPTRRGPCRICARRSAIVDAARSTRGAPSWSSATGIREARLVFVGEGPGRDEGHERPPVRRGGGATAHQDHRGHRPRSQPGVHLQHRQVQAAQQPGSPPRGDRGVRAVRSQAARDY